MQKHFTVSIGVFNESSNQSDIFQHVQPIINHVKQGYHATILAYGQTGAGKTYTMGESDGIVPRVIQAIFEECDSDSSIQIFVTFMEVYNEEVYDLLAPVPTKLTIKGFTVQNLTKVAVYSELDAFVRLEEGVEGRRFCATQANAQSSRSHAIFSLHLQRSVGLATMFSTLHLVDLAGSESVKKTGNQGIAFLEGININKGLLSLGKVIAARAGRQQGHVPFRDSVLTSVLKDSLCGNSYVTIIACISPSDADLQETVNTLRFVQRARKITNQPKINQAISDNSDKLKDFQNLMHMIPPTPAHWKFAGHASSATGRTVKGTPMKVPQRKPLSVVNFSLPSPMTPRYNLEHSNVSYASVRSTNSPPLSLPNLSVFEPSRCSSSLSFITAKSDDQDISAMMNTLLSEKMEEFRSQTEELIERKVQDTLKALKVAPLTSQLHRVSQNFSSSGPSASIGVEDTTLLDLFSPPKPFPVCKLFPSPGQSKQDAESQSVDEGNDAVAEIATSPMPAEQTVVAKRRRSMRIMEMSSQPNFESNGTENDTLTLNTSTPEKEVAPRRRRSMRLEGLHRQSTLVDEMRLCLPPVVKRRRSSLSMRSYRSSQNTSCLTQETSPGTEQFLREMQPSMMGRRRSSRRHSIADACQQTSPVEEKKTRRRSMAPVVLTAPTTVLTAPSVRRGRKSVLSLLEEKLAISSPLRGNPQEKHNQNILNFLNSENLRGLQQLPTVGPKTAFIIFNYRKLNGPFANIEALQNVPGLAKSYFHRFLQANNLKL
ncbi:hypothetical protein B566_EDAN016493 [Ephemera danica]|nr:hypothetical protein B566_EDAN016493 [Ephemera danica]